MIQSEAYVENVSLAHLLYERRLMEVEGKQTNAPDIGGQAFTIADPNPPVTYGDLYHALSVLTDGKTVFPKVPPVVMLIVAHAVEALYLSRIFLTSAPLFGVVLNRFLPAVDGDILNLQPSLFPLTSV